MTPFLDYSHSHQKCIFSYGHNFKRSNRGQIERIRGESSHQELTGVTLNSIFLIFGLRYTTLFLGDSNIPEKKRKTVRSTMFDSGAVWTFVSYLQEAPTLQQFYTYRDVKDSLKLQTLKKSVFCNTHFSATTKQMVAKLLSALCGVTLQLQFKFSKKIHAIRNHEQIPIKLGYFFKFKNNFLNYSTTDQFGI